MGSGMPVKGGSRHPKWISLGLLSPNVLNDVNLVMHLGPWDRPRIGMRIGVFILICGISASC